MMMKAISHPLPHPMLLKNIASGPMVKGAMSAPTAEPALKIEVA